MFNKRSLCEVRLGDINEDLADSSRLCKIRQEGLVRLGHESSVKLRLFALKSYSWLGNDRFRFGCIAVGELAAFPHIIPCSAHERCTLQSIGPTSA